MAGRIEVAQGYVTIIPSLKGARAKLESELGSAATAAGKSAGAKIEQGISEGASKGAKDAGKSVQDAIPKAADSAGKDAGQKVAKGLSEPVGKASDNIAKDVQSKLSGAFKGIGDKMRGIGGSIGDALGGIGGKLGGALSGVSSKIGGSKIGQAFNGIAAGAKTAFAGVTGTVKGVAGFMGSAFSTAAKGVGSALGRIGTVAGAAFSGVKAAASSVASGVSGVFGGIASKVGPALSGIGKVASVAFKGVAAGVAAAAAGVGAIGKQALDAYGGFEQLEGGIKLSLGDKVWADVERRSESAFSNMQISQNDYLTKVNSMATGLREALGGKGHEQEAADLADRVIKTQADIVSAMGISQEAADNAFNGIMKGNFTMLDNLALGIKPTKEGMQEVIDKMNEWNRTASDREATNYQIDNLADCQSAIADYVEYMGLSGYATAEGSETIQGSVAKMKGAWSDWVAELGKSDGDMGRVTANLSQSVQEVAGNVIPVLGNAVSAAVQQLPTLIATVGPQLGEALVSTVDSATGGMATKAVEMAQPITDALKGAFDGMGSWLGEHSGQLEALAGKFADFGGKVSEFVGGAISAAGPVVEGFASAALPALSSGLDLLGGAFTAAKGFVENFGNAISPVTDALAPLAEAIGGALCNALSALGDWLGNINFEEWGTKVHDALQGVVDFVQARINDIKGFFEGVGKFIDDPIGSIQSGLADLFGATEGTAASVSGSFQTMANGAKVSTDSMVGSIQTVNGTPLNGKSASFTANGNVISSSPSGKINDVSRAAGNLQGKSVEISANGNVVNNGGTIADRIWGVVGAVSNMFSKSIDVTTNYKTTGQPGNARGGIIRRFAEGAIFTKPTMTDVGIVGEAGAEAVYSNGRDTGIFPLTNRRFTGPFASEIADQVARRTDSRQPISVTISGVSSPDEVARAVTRALALANM